MQIISTIGLITINETMVVQLISFLIFLFIMNRLMFRPLRGVMAERDEYIQTVQSDIVRAEEKFKVLCLQLKDKESEIKGDALALKEKSTESGHLEADTILAGTREEIETLAAAAEKDIAEQLSKARTSIKTESEILATTLIERILDRRLAS